MGEESSIQRGVRWGVLLCLLLAGCTSPAVPPVRKEPRVAKSSPRREGTLSPPATITPALRDATDQPEVSVSTPSPSPLPPFPSPSPAPRPIQHVVQPGETLLELAMGYGLPMAAIQLANGLGESETLQAGRVLTIPPPAPRWEGASPFWVVYEVRPGDTLIRVAGRYGLTTEALLAANPLTDPDRLDVGQWLVLPLSAPRPSPTPTPAPRRVASVPSPTPRPAPTAVTSTPSPGPSPVPTGVALPPAEGPPADVADWPAVVVALINERRAAHGLSPLTWSPTLAQAAQTHAEDCSRRGWCSHVGSDGARLRDRLARLGYTPRFAGENWVNAKDPEGAVLWWYDEPPGADPHRRNLLSSHYTEIGVGVARASWGYYFIADLAGP